MCNKESVCVCEANSRKGPTAAVPGHLVRLIKCPSFSFPTQFHHLSSVVRHSLPLPFSFVLIGAHARTRTHSYFLKPPQTWEADEAANTQHNTRVCVYTVKKQQFAPISKNSREWETENGCWPPRWHTTHTNTYARFYIALYDVNIFYRHRCC